MKPKYNYHASLSEVVIHALLFLQFKINASERHIPTPQRNKLLKAWLEPKVKDPNYKDLKSDLKKLVIVAKKKTGDVEEKLLELNRLSNEFNEKFTDADMLYIFFNALKERFGLDSKSTPETGEVMEEDIIYIANSELESGLDDNNALLRPLMAHVLLSGDVSVFLNKVRSINSVFDIQLIESIGSKHTISIHTQAL